MKKLLLIAAFAVAGLTNVNAQEDKKEFKEEVNEVVEMAKEGGFYIGANIGFSVINSAVTVGNTDDDYGSFNFGFDAAYLFEVIPNLEVGALVGYTQFIASGEYSYLDDDSTVKIDFKDASFVPVAVSGRYYFADRKFFGGLDLGVGISVSDDAKTGFYARPKFGFNLNKITLIASFQSISGGQNYNESNGNQVLSLNGFKSINVGIEYGF